MKNKLEQIIVDKVTDLVQALDNERSYKAVKLSFDNSISNFSLDIPEDGDQVNNYWVDIELNEAGRMKTLVISMQFDYDEINNILELTC
jgi:hypothetical protein